MRFRQWLQTRRFQNSKGARSRVRRGLSVERLEGRDLLAVAHPGIHIPPMGVSGPALIHPGIHIPPMGVSGPASVHPGIHIPPMGVSHPSPSPPGMGSRPNSPASVLAEIQQLMGSNMNNGGMMGGGMMM